MFEESKHFSSGVFEVQDSSWKFKEEVAETAISLFKRDGYNNVTVNDICKACGISRSVFYSSFNGKRSILEYMVEKPQHNDDKSFMKFAHEIMTLSASGSCSTGSSRSLTTSARN